MNKSLRIISIMMVLVLTLLSLTSCGRVRIKLKNKEPETTTESNIVTVMFPEGYTVLQIAQKLEDNEVCSKDAFLEVCSRPVEGITIDNPDDRVFLLEGYVFADTYDFYKNSDPQTVLNKFITNYKSKITTEHENRAKELGYTMDQILTLASILQKECDEDIAECSTVSSVFHNRLGNPGFQKLQSDVTSFYIKKNLGEYLGYNSELKNLEEQNEQVQKYMNLYSTYYCKGLPAGPICNPSMKAITAALYPAETKYFYFLTDETCKNFFYAETYEQHLENGKKAGIL